MLLQQAGLVLRAGRTLFVRRLKFKSRQALVGSCLSTAYACCLAADVLSNFLDLLQKPQASFLGVGAPEALLVGVVALIVFGPKGLAEVWCVQTLLIMTCFLSDLGLLSTAGLQAAKSLGKTVRSFQPTLKELASVSSELKSTLEEQIGLDEIRQEFRQGPDRAQGLNAAPTSAVSPVEPSSSGADSAHDQLPLQPLSQGEVERIDPDIERKRAGAAREAWSKTSSPGQPDSSLEGLSIDELEALLARKRAAQSKSGS